MFLNNYSYSIIKKNVLWKSIHKIEVYFSKSNQKKFGHPCYIIYSEAAVGIISIALKNLQQRHTYILINRQLPPDFFEIMK